MKGCISLGAETDLVRRRRKSDDAELEIHRTVRPERMPVWKDIPLDMSYPECGNREVDMTSDVRMIGAARRGNWRPSEGSPDSS